MPVTINGNGTITGVSVGGLPDGIVDTDMLAANAVTDPKENLSGTAKAWVNFNGEGTVAIRDSFNVSSISDNGTGQYTINFSNAMSNADYAVATAGGGGSGSLSDGCNISSLTTNGFFSHWGSGGSQSDFPRCHFIVMGDQ